MADKNVSWFQGFRRDEGGRVYTGICGMSDSECLEKWEGTDVDSFIEFRKKHPNAHALLIAPFDKGYPEVTNPAPTPIPVPQGGEKFLKVCRTGSSENGLEKLLLTIEGTEKHWYVNSGARGVQTFLKGGTGELPGTLYPAPQGEYSVSDIEWAGGKDNWDASHGAGLGPVFVPFEPKFATKRGAFGFHWDSNRDSSPGSAGCMVFATLAEVRSFVEAMRQYDPKKFVVDWGIGAPKAEPTTDPAWEKISGHPWKNGGDNSRAATVEVNRAQKMARIVSDADTDADGSPRIGSIDPDSGQSTTSLARTQGKWNGWKGKDGLQFVNSETIPYWVIPLNWKEVIGLEVKGGDLCKINYKGKSVYAICADEGPRNLIGEISIKACEALGGNPWNAARTKIVSGLGAGVEYVIKMGSVNFDACVDFESIQTYGAQLFGASPAPVPFEILKVGMSGDKVEALQVQLNRVFSNVVLVEDGKFGPKTQEAVALFQKLSGMLELGYCDQGTWDKLLATKAESLAKPGEVVKPGAKALVCPFATQVEQFKTSWNYDLGYPKGLVVHFTATGPSAAQEDGVEEYMRPRWSVWMMKRSGELMQTFPLNRGGYHCGTWHHDVCLGIEIVAAGRCNPVQLDGVTKYAPWYAYNDADKLVHPEYCFDKSEMRYSGPNKIQNIYAGWYQKYTPAQEEQLIKLCLWLKEQAPSIFSFDLVVGHDEACDVVGRPGAKNDPGATLSMDMPAFREKLKALWGQKNP